jgi:hypothetical protein
MPGMIAFAPPPAVPPLPNLGLPTSRSKGSGCGCPGCGGSGLHGYYPGHEHRDRPGGMCIFGSLKGADPGSCGCGSGSACSCGGSCGNGGGQVGGQTALGEGVAPLAVGGPASLGGSAATGGEPPAFSANGAGGPLDWAVARVRGAVARVPSLPIRVCWSNN